MSLMRMVESLQNRLDELTRRQQRTVYKQTALASTDWEVTDTRSTTAKTLIDLSAVFGVPAGVRAVYVYMAVKDTASASTDTYIVLGPDNVAYNGEYFSSAGQANSSWSRQSQWVACDANGDIYYQVAASGSNTTTAQMLIKGWLL